jgi:hypothetical protein
MIDSACYDIKVINVPESNIIYVSNPYIRHGVLYYDKSFHDADLIKTIELNYYDSFRKIDCIDGKILYEYWYYVVDVMLIGCTKIQAIFKNQKEAKYFLKCYESHCYSLTYKEDKFVKGYFYIKDNDLNDYMFITENNYSTIKYMSPYSMIVDNSIVYERDIEAIDGYYRHIYFDEVKELLYERNRNQISGN